MIALVIVPYMAQINLEIWGVWCVEYPFFVITPRPTLTGVIVLIMVLSMCQIDLFKNDSFAKKSLKELKYERAMNPIL